MTDKPLSLSVHREKITDKLVCNTAQEVLGALRDKREFTVSTALTELFLWGSNIGELGAKSLSDSLKGNTTLKKLSLCNNVLGYSGVKPLSDLLKENNTLTGLDLDGNNIGDEGLKSIAGSLKENTTLTGLGLHGNNIGDEGAKALLESMKVNCTIKTFSLSSNHITGDLQKSLEDEVNINQDPQKVLVKKEAVEIASSVKMSQKKSKVKRTSEKKKTKKLISSQEKKAKKKLAIEKISPISAQNVTFEKEKSMPEKVSSSTTDSPPISHPPPENLQSKPNLNVTPAPVEPGLQLLDPTKTKPTTMNNLVDSLLWQAGERIALVITMSDYTVMRPLVTSKNDGDEITNFLQDCNFTVKRIHNETNPEIIDAEFSSVNESLRKDGDSKKAVFIYYSGHGFLVDGVTLGVTISGAHFSLEQKIRNISLRANSLVIGFLDCCREIPTTSKGTVLEKTKGQLFLIYAVGPGKSAFTRNKVDGLSEVTHDFLKVVRKSTGKLFPECLQNWARLHPTVEFVEKVQYKFPLLPNCEIPVNPDKFTPPSCEFKDWQPHEICDWFLTLSLSENYTKKIVNQKIDGAGLLALIELNAMSEAGFDVFIDTMKIKKGILDIFKSNG